MIILPELAPGLRGQYSKVCRDRWVWLTHLIVHQLARYSARFQAAWVISSCNVELIVSKIKVKCEIYQNRAITLIATISKVLLVLRDNCRKAIERAGHVRAASQDEVAGALHISCPLDAISNGWRGSTELTGLDPASKWIATCSTIDLMKRVEGRATGSMS